MTEEIPKELQKKYIPMTETTYYTLLALISARHGYAIMQFVSKLTNERIKLGTGTLYTMVGRLITDGLIILIDNDSGKKTYQITKLGITLLSIETTRLQAQLENGINLLGGLKNE
ncbi:MAG: PadR family transcriptional regulator [Lachnospiraceae bacterium]|nr:PadR family transcriptional regulator [Lachnospiraceae bacterium]